MTQLTPEHFELHSMNKAKKFEDENFKVIESVENLNGRMFKGINRIGKSNSE